MTMKLVPILLAHILSTASARGRDSTFFVHECNRCLLLLRRVYRINDKAECESRCVLFDRSYLQSGWNCEPCDDLRTSYDIQLDMKAVAVKYQEAFQGARNRWEEVITGDLPDVQVEPRHIEASFCPSLPDIIDDLFICPEVEYIDGTEGIIGWAKPEWIRRGPPVTSFIGIIVIDSADADDMISLGVFDDVILHEMGHVIGLGTLWQRNGLLGQDECSYKLNTRATAEYQDISKCNTMAVPVETGGGKGTACGHWDERFCLEDELMTGYLSGNMALSRITIGSLDDMGLDVNYNAADPFTANDIGFMCDCTRRARRSAKTREDTDEKSAVIVLSKESITAAVKFGKTYLRDMASKRKDSNRGENDKMEYVGDKIVAVFVKENDKVFSVVVKTDD